MKALENAGAPSRTHETERKRLLMLDPATLQTVAECIAAQEALTLANIYMDSQIAAAKATVASTGVYANARWFRDTCCARRVLGVKLQRVQERRGELARLDRAQKAHSNWPQRFVDAAKIVLDEKTIERIVAQMEKLP